MKKLLLLASCLVISIGAFAQKWIDASSFDVYGKAIPTQEAFIRIDVEKYPLDGASMNRQGGQTAGLFLHFQTNSSYIYARWTTSDRNSGDNHDAIAQKGLDLYMLSEGEWVFAGVGRPTMKKAPFSKHEYQIVKNIPEKGKQHEFLLYLPLYDTCPTLEIGIEEEATIESLPNPFRHKVLMVGSSITQGASSSRAGLLFSSQFTRMTGIYMLNLGFSGNCKLQDCLATFLADVQDVDAIVIDGFSNPTPEEITERFEPFVRKIRAAHPGIPIIMIPAAYREARLVNTKYNSHYGKVDKTVDKVINAYQGDKDFYFLPDVRFNKAGDGLQTTDGVHMNDLGCYLFMQDFVPSVKKILKKYGIK